VTDRRAVSERLTKSNLERCVRHLEAARSHRSKLAALTKDADLRRQLRGAASGLTTAIDHLRTEWRLR
jgi:hypothetical protein